MAARPSRRDSSRQIGMPFVPSPGRGRITVSDFVRDALLNRLQAVYSANPPLTDTAPSWALRIRPAQHERYSGDGSYDPIQRQSIVDQIKATRREALLRQGYARRARSAVPRQTRARQLKSTPRWSTGRVGWRGRACTSKKINAVAIRWGTFDLSLSRTFWRMGVPPTSTSGRSRSGARRRHPCHRRLPRVRLKWVQDRDVADLPGL